MTRAAGEPATSIRTISRGEFVVEFGRALRPGDHVTLLGPTGLGKSTLIGQVIPHTSFSDVAIVMPKGRDPAYEQLGHPTRVWPPRMGLVESLKILFGVVRERHAESGPRVWRLQIPVRRPEDFDVQRVQIAKLLRAVLARRENARRSLMVVIDDSRFVSDQMKLAPLVTAVLIMARSKRATIVNNYQAPRWVPREGLDQQTHTLLWRNRDRDVVKRLAEISGELDLALIEATLRRLDYHELLWVDGRANSLTVVRAD